MLSSQSLVQDICLGATENFSRWSDGQVQSHLNPAWSWFYVQCRRCLKPVLNDKNWLQAHWKIHVLAGEVVPISLRPKERKGENER